MLSWLLSNSADLQFTVLLLVVAWAFLRGAAPEWLCAIILLCLACLDWPYHLVFGEAKWGSLDLGHTLLDLGASLALVFVALHANRLYPLWLASFQISSLLSHFARVMIEPMGGGAYAVLTIFPSYFEIAILFIGTQHHRRRHSIYGRYRSWHRKSFLNHRFT